MLQRMQNHAVRIVMGVAFYLFGFFVVANALNLADHEIVIGLAAGVIGGVTMLATVMRHEQGSDSCARPSVSSPAL
jgi:hypothetical protein